MQNSLGKLLLYWSTTVQSQLMMQFDGIYERILLVSGSLRVAM